MTIIHLAIICNDLCHALFAAPKLISKRHHTIRSMVTKFIHHAITFFDQIILLFGIVPFITRCGQGSPERKLRFHVNTQQISRHKCSVRRAAGVITVMIDTVRFGNAHNADPFFYGSRNRSGHWKDQTIVFATQECRCPVDQKFSL